MASVNEAYDLELFQPRQPRLVALKDSPKVAKEKKKRARRQSILNVIAYLAVAILAVAMVGYFITCNVRLTELNSAISRSQTELSTLQSEKVRLQAELAGKTSAGQIEEYALENGMLPAESNQIYYIKGEGEDLVEIASGGQGWLQQLWIALFG